jgi:hypothetical protein
MFQEISELRLAQADGGLPAVSPRSARWSIAKFPAVRDGAGKLLPRPLARPTVH